MKTLMANEEIIEEISWEKNESLTLNAWEWHQRVV